MNPLEIHIPETGVPPPHEEIPYYFASKGGWMTNMPTLFGVAQVPLKEGPPTLPEIKGSFRLNTRKFPVALLRQAHAFFQKVWEKQHTESSLYIIYNRQTDEFKLWAPEQYVSMVSVNHRIDILPQPWTTAGTIHSHCNFSAFHSGTDQHDMEGLNGLHITIGHVDRETPEYAIALSVGSHQFDVEMADVISDEQVTEFSFPTHWLQFVKTGTAPWTGGITTTYKKHYSKFMRKPTTWEQNHTPQTQHSKLVPFTPMSNSKRIQERWDQQAWIGDDWAKDEANAIEGNTHQWGNEDDYEYYDFLKSHENGTTDAPSNAFNMYREDIADCQYELSKIGEQLEELGFEFDWSIAWNPTYAQQRMFDDSPTP